MQGPKQLDEKFEYMYWLRFAVKKIHNNMLIFGAEGVTRLSRKLVECELRQCVNFPAFKIVKLRAFDAKFLLRNH